jgi:hypothetical protein
MRFARELAWPPRLAKMAATDRDGSIAGRIAVRSPCARAGMLIAIVATALHSASLSALELNECCSPSAHRECSTQVYRSLSYPVRDERGQWLVQTSTVPSHSNLARSARNGIESSAAIGRHHFGINRAAIVINPCFSEINAMGLYDEVPRWRFDKAGSGMMRRIESR